MKLSEQDGKFILEHERDSATISRDGQSYRAHAGNSHERHVAATPEDAIAWAAQYLESQAEVRRAEAADFAKLESALKSWMLRHYPDAPPPAPPPPPAPEPAEAESPQAAMKLES